MKLTLIAAPLAAAALVVGAAVPASAATASPRPSKPHVTASSSLNDIQSTAATVTAHQLDALKALVAKVPSDKTLSDADRTKALAILNDDIAGITALQAAIAADTTAAQAFDDYRTVFTNYRVHAVALPQVHIAEHADRLTAATLPRLQKAQKKLADALAAHSDKNTADVQAAMNDLGAQISTLQSDIDGLPGAALALAPSVFNADHKATSDVSAKLTAATQAAAAAAKDIRSARAGLKR